MAADYNTAAALCLAAGYDTPPIIEQINNYVLTSQGKDAAGNDRVAKYVNLSPDYDIPTFGDAFILLECTDPVSLEKVSQIVLTE